MKNMWSPVVYYIENGMDALDSELRTKDIEYLRKLVSYHHMDDTSRFRKYDKDKLIDLIKDMSYRRAHKGDAFRIF